MQGQRASLSTLTESLNFDRGSSSNDNGVDSQMSLNETNIQYLPHVRREDWNAVWSLGETSSSAAEQSHINDNETKGVLNSEEHSNFLSLDNIGVSSNINQITSGSFPFPNSTLPQDMFGDDDYQIVEHRQSSSSLPDSSRKRKSVEPVHVGDSSEARSSNFFENAETSQFHAENDLLGNTRPEQATPRLRLGVSRGSTESTRRNLRLRINGLHQQDPIAGSPFPVETDAGNPTGNEDVSSSRDSSRLFSAHEQYIRSVRRNPRNNGERYPVLYEEHPMFVPASGTGSSVQQPANWNVDTEDIVGNVPSASEQGSGLGVNPSVPTWSHRSYPRRLSEIVRRSLVSSAGTDAGGQSGDQAVRSSSSTAAEAAALSSGSDNTGRHARISRSALLARHLEIRHVLDLMRRGDGMGIEDAMILDHSVFFGMADIHDRHRDMRLDVDNMSYEELLALEERIGNVCTGLSEETIMSRLRQHKYKDNITMDQGETEPCSICREEYIDGEDLGMLECQHDFHKDCIKQWLMQKNLCPICKATGLNT